MEEFNVLVGRMVIATVWGYENAKSIQLAYRRNNGGSRCMAVFIESTGNYTPVR